MKKVLIAVVSGMLTMGAIADVSQTTETFTNAMGQVFTVVTGYEGDGTQLITLESNANAVKLRGGYVYVTSATAVTNVSFSAELPVGEDITFLNLGTNNITIADSATMILGADHVLATEDSLRIHCISGDTAIEVGGVDVN